MSNEARPKGKYPGEMWSGFADELPDVLYRLRLWPDEAFEYINAAVEHITGYAPAELYADPEPGKRILHPEDLSKLRQLLDTTDGAVLDYTARWVCKDGSIRSMQHRDRIVRDEPSGRPVALEGMARDVTAESAAQDTSLQYKEMVALASDSIFTWDADASLTSWNRGAGHLFGWDAGEVVGRNVHELLHTRFPESLENIMQAFLSTGQWEGRLVHTARCGRQVTVESRWTLQRNADGTAANTLQVDRDITERKRAEQERRFLSAIVESSPDAIVGGSLDGAIVSWNAGAEKLYGYTAAEAIGQHFTILADAEAWEQMERILAQVTSGKTVISHEMQRATKDGRIVEVAVTAAPVYDEHGKVIGAASISRDITERKRIEQNLRESEELFRLMAEIMPVTQVLVRASDDIVLYANTAAEQVAGMPAQQLIGGHAEYFYHLEREQKEAYLAEMKRSGSVRNVEVQRIKAAGDVFFGLASAALGVYHGDVVILTTVLDITERKQAELALAESEARLRAIIENTNDSIWSIDRNYCLLAGNSTFEHLTKNQLGRTLLVGESVLGVPYPLESKAFWKPLYDYALAGESVDIQIESVLRPGAVLECFLNPIRDEDGGITGVVGRAVNITERLRSETELREATHRLQLAVDAADIGIWNWNFADGSLEWDDRMCEMYAVSDEVRTSGLFYDVWRSRVHPDDLALAEPLGGDASRLANEWSATYRIVLPDGTIRYIHAAAIVESDRHGKQYRMTGVNRDITAQKHYEQVLQDTNALLEQRVRERTAALDHAIEQLKAADRLKDEFLAAISHELRTPLSGILGAVELLSMQLYSSMTERQQRHLDVIQESGERLLKMVSDLLRYANLTAGRVVPKHECCSLADVGIICVSKVSHAAAAKHLEMDYVMPYPSPIIISDAQYVVALLDVLLDNAIKFTPEGGHIGLEVSETDDLVQLVVWDTGIGIAPEKLKTIFKPFVQGDGGLARRYEGIGLGLAYAAKMTELLGGTIAVDSEPGKGSRFTVTLPKEP